MISEAVKDIRKAEEVAQRITLASKSEVSGILADAHARGKELCAQAERDADKSRRDAAAAAREESGKKIDEAKAEAERDAKKLRENCAGKLDGAIRLIVEGILEPWQ